MKTTVDIPDPLLRKAKRAAAERGITFKELVEEALRDLLDARRPWAQQPFEMPVFEGTGLRPGLSWSDMSKAIDMTYEGRGA
jgi:hypothetical protein